MQGRLLVVPTDDRHPRNWLAKCRGLNPTTRLQFRHVQGKLSPARPTVLVLPCPSASDGGQDVRERGTNGTHRRSGGRRTNKMPRGLLASLHSRAALDSVPIWGPSPPLKSERPKAILGPCQSRSLSHRRPAGRIAAKVIPVGLRQGPWCAYRAAGAAVKTD